VFRRYLNVTKPGIIMGNLISVAGGFLLASRGDVDPWLMVATLLGLSLVVASGCAINNVIDRDIWFHIISRLYQRGGTLICYVWLRHLRRCIQLIYETSFCVWHLCR